MNILVRFVTMTEEIRMPSMSLEFAAFRGNASVATCAGHVKNVQTLMHHRAEVGELPDEYNENVVNRRVGVVQTVLAIPPLIAMRKYRAKTLKIGSAEARIEIVYCLIEVGANPNGGKMEWMYPDPARYSRDLPGDRALYWAVRADQTMAVQLLINGKVFPMTLNRRAESAFKAAAKAGESAVIKLLLTSGAECQDGQVKHALRDTRCSSVVRVLAEAVVYLDGGGDMVWIMACEGRPLVLEALINAGAYLNAHLLNGWTPLHAAVRNSNFLCVDLLLRGGAHVNAKDKVGQTPLHVAVAQGNCICVEMLISDRARPI